jgi:putative ABC transport system permease protein
VALLASIGTFLAGALATMTSRAVRQVAVDWQVEAQPGVDYGALLQDIKTSPGVQLALPVAFAQTTSLQTETNTVQTTAAGTVLGVPVDYAAAFPGELRPLVGASAGVLLAQQTAANLHAGPGQTVTIGRAGLPSTTVKVDGVVDLPAADSLFQHVGAPAGAQPAAPPDNVVLLPEGQWHALFDPLAATRPDLVRHQVHVRLSHRLPRDPAAAFTRVSRNARHLEGSLAGAGLVGDNLAAALDAARSDALYAQVLFLVLGLPGALLAGLLTAAVAAAGAGRRRREFGLLRARGATVTTMALVAAAEAAAAAIVGAVLGLGAAALIGRVAFGSSTFGASAGAAAVWAFSAVGVGVVIAVAAVVVPAWRDARRLTVVAARRAAGRSARPLWARLGVDVWLVAGAGLVFWLTSRSGYQVVLVPEGLPTLSVNYWALSGPLLLWAGMGLGAWRLADGLFGRGREVVRVVARPVAGGLSRTVAATLARQRRGLAPPVALVALSIAFAASTAVFNTTYRHQVGVDARLTNGADVTVSYPPTAATSPSGASDLARVAGVRRVEPLQHRFAYVGADLQDLYGVRPQTIASATGLQDAYFSGGSAHAMMARLSQRPDGVLVSAETARDFQLNLGDLVRLRVRDARTGRLTEVPFHYAGIVKEFPTAPRDSFLVANAAYVADRTGDAGIETLLLDTGGGSPTTVADRVRRVLGPTATVVDLVTGRRQVGSSLTAVDLSGLTRVELGFALVLATAATGLVLVLTMAERKRSFAIARAIGARRNQVAAFVRVETGLVVAGGLAIGSLAGWALAAMVVKILTGVFDPPPAALAVPWRYLAAVVALVAVAAVLAAEATIRSARRPFVEVIRDL